MCSNNVRGLAVAFTYDARIESHEHRLCNRRQMQVQLRKVRSFRIAGFRGAAQSQILAERLQAQDVLALRTARRYISPLDVKPLPLLLVSQATYGLTQSVQRSKEEVPYTRRYTQTKVQTESGTYKLVSKLADCFTPSSLDSLAPPATAIKGS